MFKLVSQLRGLWRLRKEVKQQEIDFLLSLQRRESELLRKLKEAQEGHAKLVEAATLAQLHAVATSLEGREAKARAEAEVADRLRRLAFEDAKSTAETREHETFCKDVLGLDPDKVLETPSGRAIADAVLEELRKKGGKTAGKGADSEVSVHLQAAQEAFKATPTKDESDDETTTNARNK